MAGLNLRLLFSAPRVAVVLSGGGSRGAYQAGVLDALMRAGVRPDLVVGTSVGAINAAYWAFNPGDTDGQALKLIWLTANSSLVMPAQPFEFLNRLVRGRDHLVASDRLRALLASGLAEGARFEAAAIPLIVTATHADTGAVVRLRSGPVADAVLASAAIPGVFTSVEIDGRRLADGGLVANCDVEAAALAGATDILAVDVMGGSGWPAGSDLWTTAERSLDVMLGRQTDTAIAAISGRARVALLRPPASIMPRFGTFRHTQELFDAGHRDGAAFLARRFDPARRRVRPEPG